MKLVLTNALAFCFHFFAVSRQADFRDNAMRRRRKAGTIYTVRARDPGRGVELVMEYSSGETANTPKRVGTVDGPSVISTRHGRCQCIF